MSRPVGDTATDTDVGSGGVEISRCVSGPAGAGRDVNQMAMLPAPAAITARTAAATQRSRRDVSGAGRPTLTVVSNTPSIAKRTSPMSLMRLRGSFSRQPRRKLPSTGGRFFGSVPQSGSIAITCAKVFDTSSPVNGRAPVSISNSTTPNAQISLRLSTGLPAACSGDIYAAVPMITPICVAAAVNVGDCEGSPCGVVSSAFAKPKSKTFTVPSSRTLMFAGFKSR